MIPLKTMANRNSSYKTTWHCQISKRDMVYNLLKPYWNLHTAWNNNTMVDISIRMEISSLVFHLFITAYFDMFIVVCLSVSQIEHSILTEESLSAEEIDRVNNERILVFPASTLVMLLLATTSIRLQCDWNASDIHIWQYKTDCMSDLVEVW